MAWNEYILEYEGMFVYSFRSAFTRYSILNDEMKFRSVNYPKIEKVGRKKTVCIDIMNTLLVKMEFSSTD